MKTANKMRTSKRKMSEEMRRRISAGVKRTWRENGRFVRDEVSVNGQPFSSTWQAWDKLGLVPVSYHVQFRKELKAPAWHPAE